MTGFKPAVAQPKARSGIPTVSFILLVSRLPLPSALVSLPVPQPVSLYLPPSIHPPSLALLTLPPTPTRNHGHGARKPTQVYVGRYFGGLVARTPSPSIHW